MLQSPSRTWIDAAQPAGNSPVHQLSATLDLRFHTFDGGTKMRVGAQDPPWKVIRAFRTPEGGSLAHLHNVSGGVLAGDSLSLNIHVEPKAVAQVTTTGATRLYRHRPNSAASQQDVSIAVHSGALLEYLPDILIPYAQSRHRQRTTVTMHDSSTLFWWDMLAPGRHAMGEMFAFESLEVQTSIYHRARPLLLENFHLQPRLRAMQSMARFGTYSHMATFYAIQTGRSTADMRELETELNEIAREESDTGTIWGASSLVSDGVIVRGLSTTARDLPATLIRFWNAARRYLVGDSAVPPRKLK